MNTKTVLLSVIVLLSLPIVAFGCNDTATPSARPDRAAEVDPPLRRWSETHYLRYIQDGQLREQSLDSPELGSWVGLECRYRKYVAENGSGQGFDETDQTHPNSICAALDQPSAENGCRRALCELIEFSCAANLAMEIAQSTGSVTWHAWRPEEQQISWPVATTGDRAIAAHWAAHWSGAVESLAGRYGPSHFAEATDCGMPGWENGWYPGRPGTVLDRIGAELADHYTVQREATRARSRYLTASADASITGRGPSSELAADGEGGNVSLRRLAAAGIVPMTVDWEPRRPDDYCPASSGDPAVASATRLIRLSALDPGLLSSTGDAPSLREFGRTVMGRVERLRGRFEPTGDLESFLQREGTDLTALLGARQRLARETVVLRRSMTQLLPT